MISIRPPEDALGSRPGELGRREDVLLSGEAENRTADARQTAGRVGPSCHRTQRRRDTRGRVLADHRTNLVKQRRPHSLGGHPDELRQEDIGRGLDIACLDLGGELVAKCHDLLGLRARVRPGEQHADEACPELVDQPERELATHAEPHDDHAVDTARVERREHLADVVVERERQSSRGRRGAQAGPGQIGREERRAAAERLHLRPPHPSVQRKSVQQEDGGPSPDLADMEQARPGLCARHGA